MRSAIRKSDRDVFAAMTGSAYRARQVIAVENTPDSSFSDLFIISRAVCATTGCGPAGVCLVISMRARITSCVHVGSARNAATPASDLSRSA